MGRASKMDDLGGDDNTFLPDDVREMIREVCDSVLKPETMFKQSMVDEWTAAVVEEILKRLADQRKPFKYVGVSGSEPLKGCLRMHEMTTTSQSTGLQSHARSRNELGWECTLLCL